MHKIGRVLRTCVLAGVIAVPAVAFRAFGRLSYAFGAERPKPTPGHTSLPCPTGLLPSGY